MKTVRAIVKELYSSPLITHHDMGLTSFDDSSTVTLSLPLLTSLLQYARTQARGEQDLRKIIRNITILDAANVKQFTSIDIYRILQP